MEEKKIKVIVAQRQTKEGKKFNTYKTVSKNGRLTDLKFTKDVKELPSETCYAHILPDNMNIDKTREFPVVWVKKVEAYTTIADGSAEGNRAAIDEFFG